MPYKDASDEEKRIGLELFFTDTPGIKGRIKKEPEDFKVSERSINIEPISTSELAERDPTLPVYVYCNVRSKNWEMNRLVQMLAAELDINTDKIGFAGSKDKRAVTEQLMSFGSTEEKVKNVFMKDVEFSNFFLATRELRIGDLLGNDFEILIRDIELEDEKTKEVIEQTNEQLEDVSGFPNFFGVQRFGIIRPVTHIIGKKLVQKNYEEAILQYIGHPVKGEPAADYEARAEFDKSWDFEWAIKNYPKHLFFERILIKYLLTHPEDYARAILQFPKNLSTMFIHSYQSFLFNKILCQRIRVGLPLDVPAIGDIILPVDDDGLPVHKTWIPVNETNIKKLTKKCRQKKAYVGAVLFGSDSIFAEGEFGEIERKIIEAEGISQNDFIIPDIPQISSKGNRRELAAPVYNFNYEMMNQSTKLSFGLIKGSYATTLLREYMKSDILNY